MKLVLTLILTFFFSTLTSFGNIVILNGLSHAHDIMPGEVYTGEIVVQNALDQEQAVNLYLRDYLFYKTGEIKYEEPGVQQRSNTNWVKLSPSYVVLSPKEKKVISYEIKVPKTLPKVGTYWSVVMLEATDKMDEGNYSNSLQIKTQVRYAVQIITHAGSNFKKNLQITDVQLAQKEQTPYAIIDVENTGEYLLIPHISLELFDEAGKSVGIFKTEKRKTFPGTSLRFRVSLADTSPGQYKALLLADCGEESVFGMNLDLTLK